MASIGNTVQLSVRSRFSSLYLSSTRPSTNFLVLKNLSFLSQASRLAFSPLPESRSRCAPTEFSRKVPSFCNLNLSLRRQGSVRFPVVSAAAADADGREIEASDGLVKSSKSLVEKYPALLTGFFFFMWYFLNVIFNILNKKVYNYFPYPYFVSVVHLLVGVVYCLVSWAVGLPKRAPIDKDLLVLLTPVAVCHALGHVMSNVSFAAISVSFAHTIKALEPFFNAAASQFVLGQQIPLPLWLSLTPVVIGVSMASLTELSFNWTGFISAMISNIAFTYRSIYSKKAMVRVFWKENAFSLILCFALLAIGGLLGPSALSYFPHA